MIERARLIQAAEEAWQQEQEGIAKFRAYLSAHLGPLAAVQAEAIIRTPPGELADDLLHLACQFRLGLPPGVVLSDEQLEVAVRHRLAHICGH